MRTSRRFISSRLTADVEITLQFIAMQVWGVEGRGLERGERRGLERRGGGRGEGRGGGGKEKGRRRRGGGEEEEEGEGREGRWS